MNYQPQKTRIAKCLQEIKSNWIGYMFFSLIILMCLVVVNGCVRINAADPSITLTKPVKVSTINPDVLEKAMDATALIYAGNSMGSAWCFHESGLFITARHVVMGVPVGRFVLIRSEVGTENERIRDALVVWISGVDDVALIRVVTQEGDSPYNVLKLRDSSTLRVGEEVAAIGFPLGDRIDYGLNLRPSVAPGSVTALRRDTKGRLIRIQSDVSIAPGNSGGPVIDRRGNVIGIAVSGYLEISLNFVLPEKTIREFLGNPIRKIPVKPTPPPPVEKE